MADRDGGNANLTLDDGVLGVIGVSGRRMYFSLKNLAGE